MALEKLKIYLTCPSVLVALKLGEMLQLYIYTMTHVVSTSLVVERKVEDSVHPI